MYETVAWHSAIVPDGIERSGLYERHIVKYYCITALSGMRYLLESGFLQTDINAPHTSMFFVSSVIGAGVIGLCAAELPPVQTGGGWRTL